MLLVRSPVNDLATTKYFLIVSVCRWLSTSAPTQKYNLEADVTFSCSCLIFEPPVAAEETEELFSERPAD